MSNLGFDDSDDFLRNWYAKIDARIDARCRCVAMVVRIVPGPRVESFGTGFFYLKDGWPFFVTAKHVLDDAQKSIEKGQGAFLITRGRKGVIDLSKSEFFCSADWDLAVTPLWRRTAAQYSHVEFLAHNEVSPPPEVGLFAFTGFPASKNKTYTMQEIKPHQRVITFTEPTLEPGDQALPFLSFPIDRRMLHTSHLSHASLEFPQGLAGMSGGPVLAVDAGADSAKLTLCGMGVAWRKDSSLKVLRFDLVDAWLSQYFNW